MKDCIFCKIIKGDIPSKKVYEDSSLLAFHDINPAAPVHILIIPKKHIKSLVDAESSDIEILGKIQLTASKLAKKLKINKAFRVLAASGKKAGQTVFHLHYHLIGGWKGSLPEMESKPCGLRK
jgi:histidine triad (HIT) family protein